jgi:hypothetical protein
MSIGKILFLVAAILFLLAALGVTLIPNLMTWAFFCLALGFFLTGYDFRLKQQQ